MATLYDLPPELVVLILQAADDPRDLYALISASPIFSRVFTSGPAQILAAVLRNSIPPGALRDALALCHLTRDSSSAQDPNAAPPRSFVEIYFGTEPLSFPTDIRMFTDLCAVHRLASPFVDEYFDSISVLVSSPKAAPNEKKKPHANLLWPLSPSERTRFYRAFLRYELYCRMFLPHQTSRLDNSNQFHRFLMRIPPWAAEKVSCAYSYLSSLCAGIVDEVEDQLVHAALTVPGAHGPADSRILWRHLVRGDCSYFSELTGIREELEDPYSTLPLGEMSTSYTEQGSPDDRVSFEGLERSQLNTFANGQSYCRQKSVSNLVSRGLGFIRRLVNCGIAQRTLIVRRELRRPQPFHSFHDGLRSLALSAPILAPATPEETPPGGDDPSQPSVGYHAFASDRSAIYDCFGRHATMRAKGYALWDAQRIAGCHALSRNTSEAVTVEHLRIRPGVVKRLLGVTISRREMRKILARFGS